MLDTRHVIVYNVYTLEIRRQEMKSQVIAGHKIELTEGTNYIASRPMGKFRNITVSIRWNQGDTLRGKTVREINRLSYNEANELINAFNNDPRGSFYGRIW